MREPRLLETAEIALADIHVGPRKRVVSPAGVEAIVQSVTETGVMKDEIILRRVRHQDNRLVLVAGAARLAAAWTLAWETIPAKIYDCSDLWAEIMEIDDNLARVDLAPLDLAVQLAHRKQAHLRAFPESQRGAAGARARWTDDATDIVSFASLIAEQRGISERHVRRFVTIGAHLSTDTVATLQRTTKGATIGFGDLKALSLLEGDLQVAVARRYAQTDVANIEIATHEELGDPAPPPLPPEDRHYLTITSAFDRAPRVAVRRALEQLATEDADLLEEALEAARARRAGA
ncbi:MAG: ParB N-terminal domain-containing protein [Pseudomonadota bacterium]